MDEVKKPILISLAVAQAARLAVVCVQMRVGLSRLYLWNLETDEITPGQFLKADALVQAITPDGKYFSYFAQSHYKSPNQYVCISKPPFFTALAFFPTDESRSGVQFVDSRTIKVSSSHLQLSPSIVDGCPFVMEHIDEALPRVSHASFDTAKDRKLIGYGNRIFARDIDFNDQIIREFEVEEFEEFAPPDWAKVW